MLCSKDLHSVNTMFLQMNEMYYLLSENPSAKPSIKS